MNTARTVLILTLGAIVSLANARANDPAVKRLWSVRGKPRSGHGEQIALDSAGNALVVHGSRISKYGSSSGALLWEKDLNNNSPARIVAGIQVEDLWVDRQDHVVVLARQQEFFIPKEIVRFSPEGQLTWHQTIATNVYDLEVDPVGNVIVLAPRGNHEELFKLAAADGSRLWQQALSSDESFYSAAVDSAGDIILCGLTGPAALTTKRRGRDGTAVWRREFRPLRGRAYVPFPAVDSLGNVGVFCSILNVPEQKSYYARYAAASGAPLWEKIDARNSGIVGSDPMGHLIVAGTQEGGQFSMVKRDARSGTLILEEDLIRTGDELEISRAMVDSAGDVVLTGSVRSQIHRSSFTAKYSGDTGAPLWMKKWRTFADADEFTLGLAAGNGQVAVTGGSGRGTRTTLKYVDGAFPETRSAEVLDSSTARLRGAVTPNGLIANGGFIFGTEPSLANAETTPLFALRRGRERVNLSSVIGLLQPRTTYYYRTVGSTEHNKTYGELKSFTTPGQ